MRRACVMLTAALLFVPVAPPVAACVIDFCDASIGCGFQDPPLIRTDTLMLTASPFVQIPNGDAQPRPEAGIQPWLLPGLEEDAGESASLQRLFCTLVSSPASCAPVQ